MPWSLLFHSLLLLLALLDFYFILKSVLAWDLRSWRGVAGISRRRCSICCCTLAAWSPASSFDIQALLSAYELVLAPSSAFVFHLFLSLCILLPLTQLFLSFSLILSCSISLQVSAACLCPVVSRFAVLYSTGGCGLAEGGGEADDGGVVGVSIRLSTRATSNSIPSSHFMRYAE